MKSPASSMKAQCVRLFCASANTTICASIAYSEASICNNRVVEHNSMTTSEITDAEQWNNFLTSQPRGHLLQSYEWGELNKFLGGRIYRLGALDDGRMVGAMLLTVSQVPLPVSVPGIHLHWLYCSRGPTVEAPTSPALAALVAHAHTLACQEHTVVLRVEPNIADDDPQMGAWIAAYRAMGFQTNPIAVHGRRSWVLDIR